MSATIHVHVQVDALANSQIAELGFFEICVYPDVVQRADGHEGLTHLHVVARVYVAPSYDAIDLRDNCAVTQIEVCLVEIALSLQQTCFGLLESRSVLDDLSKDAIEIAGRVAPVKFFQGLFRCE